MFLGGEFYPTTLERVIKILLIHGPGGDLRIEVDTVTKDKEVKRERIRVKNAPFEKLLYVLGADMAATSVVVALPRWGLAVYWTNKGEYVISEPVKGLRNYLADCLR